MDRRQRKTKDAIFRALIMLLGKKDFNRITVSEIIDSADVGRATFYAHFETKEFLAEPFVHIFDSDAGTETLHRSLFEFVAPDSAFLHLFRHLQNNDNRILELLNCRNNELFLSYFRENVKELVKSQLPALLIEKPSPLPDDFWVNHVAATFVETVRWWAGRNMPETPEKITEYFLCIINVKQKNIPD